MTDYRRPLRVMVILTMAALMLTGCDIFRRARRVPAEPPPPFQSPVVELVGRPGMTLQDIIGVYRDRATDTRALLGTLSLNVGEARSRTRYQVDANMYFAPPDFLRIRGSSNIGTLFDFLLKDGQATVSLPQDKVAHSGSLAQLRSNSTVLAGVQPDDLMSTFLVERNLYHYLTTYSNVTLQENPTHYVASITYPTGVTENYQIRQSDLLVDRVERFSGRRLLGTVRIDGYGYFQNENAPETRHLLPTRFEAQLPSGATATVISQTLTPNAPRPEALNTLEVPADFQRRPL